MSQPRLSNNAWIRDSSQRFTDHFNRAFQFMCGSTPEDFDSQDKHAVYMLVSANKDLITLVSGVYVSIEDYTFSYEDDDDVVFQKLRHLYLLCGSVARRMEIIL